MATRQEVVKQIEKQYNIPSSQTGISEEQIIKNVANIILHPETEIPKYTQPTQVGPTVEQKPEVTWSWEQPTTEQQKQTETTEQIKPETKQPVKTVLEGTKKMIEQQVKGITVNKAINLASAVPTLGMSLIPYDNIVNYLSSGNYKSVSELGTYLGDRKSVV